ncbi:hypothetical protein [Bacillus rubiinfantis]|uniref:hypothetical protein n=1 Tax=Bacillus rubiinfantis TaxID=1499680 RepID=UPI000ACA891D|nr:hypothetical protein [Bacillus rubiinfantis]
MKTKTLKEVVNMNNKQMQFPTREELDHAFHYIHDQINRIAVLEEAEMIAKEHEENPPS